MMKKLRKYQKWIIIIVGFFVVLCGLVALYIYAFVQTNLKERVFIVNNSDVMIRSAIITFGQQQVYRYDIKPRSIVRTGISPNEDAHFDIQFVLVDEHLHESVVEEKNAGYTTPGIGGIDSIVLTPNKEILFEQKYLSNDTCGINPICNLKVLYSLYINKLP